MTWRLRSVLLCRGGASSDGNVDRMGEAVIEAFRQEGWHGEVVNLGVGDYEANERAVVARLRAGAFDLMVSLQDMGHYNRPDAAEIFAEGGVRRLYWGLDHTYSAWKSVLELPPGTIVSFPTASNLQCCRRFLRQDLVLHCLAHAAAPLELEPPPDGERPIAALFIGNRGRQTPEEMMREWPRQHDALAVRVLHDMADAFDALGSESLEGLTERVLAAHHIRPDRPTFFGLLQIFDAYAWARSRAAYVEALAGLPVTFVGRGWEGVVDTPARALGPLPSAEARALMTQARVVINILPAYYRSHERIFDGMAAGAAVASTGRDVIANALGEERDAADDVAIAYLGPPDQAGERLRMLLADEAARRAMAEAGRAEQRARHTWRARVAALLASLAGEA